MRNVSGYASSSPANRSTDPRSPFFLVLRIALISCSLVASAALAFVLLVHVHSAAHADPALLQTPVPAINQSFGSDPWDIKFDKNGHVFVAEPQCDVNVSAFPVCGLVHTSGIIEYSVSGFNNGGQPIAKLIEPSNYSSPFFLAFDSSGNLWFTEPVTNSIGEYDTGGNWHQWTVPTAGASPLDLIFDQYGHLWFTELTANKIGVFDPASGTFINEYATPTPNSQPYGITGPDPTTHAIWFTENSGAVHRIGQLMPNPDGTIQNNQMNEYLTNISCPGNNCITPHLITYDQSGNIWWSEGYDGAIGQLVVSQAQPGTNKGVTEHVVPAATCPSCGASHISGISVDSNGTVWFDDSLTSRYGSYNPSSGFSMFVVGTLGGNDHPHDGLTVDCNNNVWFSEEFANTLAEAQTGAANGSPCSSPQPSPTTTVTPTGTPQPGLQPGPVNKTWYFAEGRVGGHFTEYLSMDNPTANPCAVNIEYLYTPDRGAAQIKNVQVTIPANTRYEEGVDGDLGTSPNGPGITDSAIVTVNSQVTPNCAGIVAERPMYFNALGTNSGSDVLGVTTLARSFYIGDVAVGAQPGGGSVSSFITILNPPGGQTANVTATYYANGQPVGTDTVQVAGGTRGTIFPNKHSPALPAHTSVVVTSDQPIAVERPEYFSNINGGNAGIVSGGADVIAVQSLANDWLFAEGYTGGQFQENFVIANLDTSANATAQVTIKLEPQGGSVSTFTLPVAPRSQVIWNVNTQSHLPGQSLSAEISSTGAKIVVEREMFFRYLHNANGRTLAAVGGSDVLGQPGPAAQTIYSFAEGYVNAGYDEWLTLQNPTSSPETVWITLYNAVGTTYTYSVIVAPNSRATQDIVYVVLHNLYHNGDGFKGFEVSMTVQTTSSNGGPVVVERPMYWNAAATQGGSDILGYTGG